MKSRIPAGKAPAHKWVAKTQGAQREAGRSLRTALENAEMARSRGRWRIRIHLARHGVNHLPLGNTGAGRGPGGGRASVPGDARPDTGAGGDSTPSLWRVVHG